MWGSKSDDAIAWGWVLCVIGGIITTLITPLYLYWGLTYLISPEYYAVFDMIKKIQGNN